MQQAIADETLFETLRADHDRQRRLFTVVLDESVDLDARLDAAGELFTELEAHAAAEERSLYAAILAEGPTRAKSVHGIEEHEAQRALIAELGSLKPGGDAWTARVCVLRDKVEHHLMEEEQVLFQMAGKVLTDEQKSDMAERFLRHKAEFRAARTIS